MLKIPEMLGVTVLSGQWWGSRGCKVDVMPLQRIAGRTGTEQDSLASVIVESEQDSGTLSESYPPAVTEVSEGRGHVLRGDS